MKSHAHTHLPSASFRLLAGLALAAATAVPAAWGAPAPAKPSSAAGASASPAAGSIEIALPTPDCSVWFTYQDAANVPRTTPPAKAPGQMTTLDQSALGPKFSNPALTVLDATGNAGTKALSLKPGVSAKVTVTAADINRVYQFRVRALDAGRQPASSGSVTLTDSKGTATTLPLTPGTDGTVEFKMVPFGQIKTSVTFADKSKVELGATVGAAHAPGPVVQEIVALGAAPATAPGTPAGAGVPAPPAGAAPPAGSPTTPGAPPPGGAAAPGAPAAPGGAPAGAAQGAPPAPGTASAPAGASLPAPAPPSSPAPAAGSGGGGIGSVVGVILFAALGYVGYRWAREKGIKLEDLLKRVGVDMHAAPAPSAADPAAAKPAQAPPPVVPAGHCPFCGQMKDASGNCGCSVPAAGAAGPFAAPARLAAAPGMVAGPAPGMPSVGPRLVVVGGPALGASFPLTDGATIGRTAENVVALTQDETVSRTHASLSRQGAAFVLRDANSRNGTFVNALQVAEHVLQPGDVVQVGNSQLRYDE